MIKMKQFESVKKTVEYQMLMNLDTTIGSGIFTW